MKKIILLLLFILSSPLKERSISASLIDLHIPVVLKVKSSVYNPDPRQTDDSPLVTAKGYVIDTAKLKKLEIKWVALSQNLIKTYNKDAKFSYGDTIYIISPIHEKIYGGRFIVTDCMNKRFTNSIDFLQHKKTTKRYLIPDSVKIIKL